MGGTQCASGGISINYFPREVKNLDIGGTLDNRFVFKSETPLSTFVFKEEVWLNWFGRSPWLTSFSQRGSFAINVVNNIENAFLRVGS